MKVYVTKYALTKGIIEVDDAKFLYNNHVVIRESRCEPLISPVDWFKTKQEAINRASKMRINKIASLRKRIEELEEMKFD